MSAFPTAACATPRHLDLPPLARLVEPAPLADPAAPLQAIGYINARIVVAVDRHPGDRQLREAFDMLVRLEQYLLAGAE